MSAILGQIKEHIHKKEDMIWRLFQIMPSEDNQDTLEVKTIGMVPGQDVDIGGFIALSRAWQEPQEAPGSATIMFDGESKDVPRDLYDFLYHLRDREKSQVFWERSLCSDMTDVIEKNVMCRTISVAFYAAAKVIVWLGKDTPVTSSAMDVLASKEFPALLDPARLSQYAQNLDAVETLVNKPWFWNLVNTYEIMAAYRGNPYDSPSCKVYLLCGSSELLFLRLYEAWKCWNTSSIKDSLLKRGRAQRGPRLFYNIPFFRALEGLEPLRLHDSKSPRASQLEWIVQSQRMGFEAEDESEHLTLFQYISGGPDWYLRSVMTCTMLLEDLNQLVVAQSILIEGTKAFSYLRPPNRRTPGTLSWSPDFLQLSKHSWPFAEIRDSYNAGMDVSHYIWLDYPGTPCQYAALQFLFETDQEDKKACYNNDLCASGFIYDTVGWFSDAPDIYENEVPYPHIQEEIRRHNYEHTMASIKRYWVAGAMPTSAILTDEGRDAFWRTLICDRDAKGRRVPPGSDMGKRFDKWIADSLLPFTSPNKSAQVDHEESVAREAATSASARLNELQQQTQALHKARKRSSEETRKETQQLRKILAEHRKEGWVREYSDLVVQRSYERSLITTNTRGTFGMAARGVRKGDSILVARGAQAPLIIRKIEDGTWFLVGEAYIHGIMSGEFILKSMQQGRKVERFALGGMNEGV